MSNSLSATLLQVEMEVSDLMRGLREKLDKVFNEYTDQNQITKLPPFKELVSNDKLRYETSKSLTDSIDVLNEMKLRVSIMKHNLDEYKRFQAPSKIEYAVAQRFVNNIKEYINELDTHYYNLNDLIRNANSKLRVIDSAQFYNA